MKTYYIISSVLTGTRLLGEKVRDLIHGHVRFRSAMRGILIGLLFLFCSYRVPGGELIMTGEMKFQAERAQFYYMIRDEPFSEELLKISLYYERIRYQDIVLLQAQLETGHYTSDIFLNGHNCFGMKYPERRPTVATGIYKDHARYRYWFDSVIDYGLWQEYYISRGYRIEESQDDSLYLVFLKCVRYAQDSRYVSKLVEMRQRDLT
jgi:hypothetical protein